MHGPSLFILDVVHSIITHENLFFRVQYRRRNNIKYLCLHVHITKCLQIDALIIVTIIAIPSTAN